MPFPISFPRYVATVPKTSCFQVGTCLLLNAHSSLYPGSEIYDTALFWSLPASAPTFESRENTGFGDNNADALSQNMRCGLRGDFLVSKWENKGGGGGIFWATHLEIRWLESLEILPWRRGNKETHVRLLCYPIFYWITYLEFRILITDTKLNFSSSYFHLECLHGAWCRLHL